MEEKKRGGKRLGAGRKKKEATVLKRVPVSLIDEIEHLIQTRITRLYGLPPDEKQKGTG